MAAVEAAGPTVADLRVLVRSLRHSGKLLALVDACKQARQQRQEQWELERRQREEQRQRREAERLQQREVGRQREQRGGEAGPSSGGGLAAAAACGGAACGVGCAAAGAHADAAGPHEGQGRQPAVARCAGRAGGGQQGERHALTSCRALLALMRSVFLLQVTQLM